MGTSMAVNRSEVLDDIRRIALHGNEDIKEERKKSNVVEYIQATIVRSWRNYDGRFSVELDNGQNWRETQGTRAAISNKGASVIIMTGRLGGYRMRFENINKPAWVRRTK